MSEINLTKHDHVLIGLFSSLQAAAMAQMGKIQNPATGEIERDLVQAQSTIDILDMLKTKCRTETPEDLLRFMDNSVMELQMNFLDEKKKDAGAAEDQPEDAAPAEEKAAAEEAAEKPAEETAEETADKEEAGE